MASHDYLRDVVWVVDSNTRIQYVSGSCKLVLGYKSEVLIGRHGMDLVHPDEVDNGVGVCVLLSYGVGCDDSSRD